MTVKATKTNFGTRKKRLNPKGDSDSVGWQAIFWSPRLCDRIYSPHPLGWIFLLAYRVLTKFVIYSQIEVIIWYENSLHYCQFGFKSHWFLCLPMWEGVSFVQPLINQTLQNDSIDNLPTNMKCNVLWNRVPPCTLASHEYELPGS